MLVFTILLLTCTSANSLRRQCSKESAALVLKRPTYEFSLRILDRVAQDTDFHFVFSPISTWTQLLILSEGAHGVTLKEIRNVTKRNRLICVRRKWKNILNRVYRETKSASKRKSVMVVNSLMPVKQSFVREAERLKSTEVLVLNFKDAEKAAEIANGRVLRATNGVILDAFSPGDFNFTSLLMADAAFYRNTWKVPFNRGYTTPEPFYSDTGAVEGNVDMMSRTDYFNVTEIPVLNAKVLELPCGSDGKVSMFVILPNDDFQNLFHTLKSIRIMSLINKFKKEGVKLVNVKLPKFKISTDVDNIPELLYDMGVKSLFHPNTANLSGVSVYKLYASLMVQMTEITVTEDGVSAKVASDFLLKDKNSAQEFVANKPFVFLLVDKTSEIILFAGMYSSPNSY